MWLLTVSKTVKKLEKFLVNKEIKEIKKSRDKTNKGQVRNSDGK